MMTLGTILGQYQLILGLICKSNGEVLTIKLEQESMMELG
jgi:hypothetical protein